jgi:hypothetical protein
MIPAPRPFVNAPTGAAGFLPASSAVTLVKARHQLWDLFDNPVGYRTSLGKMLHILPFLSGCCSETEVSEQLYGRLGSGGGNGF